jgi:hypothetical protein
MTCKILGLGLIMICLGRNGFARVLFHLAYMISSGLAWNDSGAYVLL